MSDVKNVDEIIEIVPYDPLWPTYFELEAQRIKEVFSTHRLHCLEHYGSTAVPGLSAKPIINILVGLESFHLSDDELTSLIKLGYELIGQLHQSVQALFLRKREIIYFNLALVAFDSKEWHECLSLRDYLRAHPAEIQSYENIKQQAINKGIKNAFDYRQFKNEFVKELNERAKKWKQIQQT